MFDISFPELTVVGIVGLLVLGPDEMLKTVKSLKKILSSAKLFYNNCLNELNDELSDDNNSVVKIIYDENGQAQHAYDIKKIQPFCKISTDE